MAKNDLMITVKVDGVDEFISETDINLCDYSKESQILDDLKEQFEENGEVTKFEVTDWQDVPDNCQDIDTALELADYYKNSYHTLEIFDAAKDCGIEFSNVDDSYQGTYKSDEDFAQETAEQIGAIDKNASWPNTCIDWEQAARELMMDYSESNGHYFRA